jgi:epoxide hydrolase 4
MPGHTLALHSSESVIAMVQHEYAHVNGIRLHYVTAGSGALLLFLHGFPDFWYLWKDQIAHFSQSYRVVAPDLRGYNLSEKPKDPGQKAAFACGSVVLLRL